MKSGFYLWLIGWLFTLGYSPIAVEEAETASTFFLQLFLYFVGWPIILGQSFH